VDLQLREIAGFLDPRRITLEVSDAARDYLGRVGFDPDYGARPLKRLIQREIQNELAKRILAGAVDEGGRVRVDLDREDRLTWEITPPQQR
jgi:ATP-dependent Clp protease ATP-binding subunit ClpB